MITGCHDVCVSFVYCDSPPKNMLSDIWCLNSRCTVGGVTVQCKLVLVLVLLAILPDVHTENHGKSLSVSSCLPKKRSN